MQIKAGILENQLRNLKQQHKHLLEASEFGDQTLMYNNPPAFLQIEGTVDNRLDKLHNEWFDKEPHEVATIGFSCKGLSNEIQNKAATMATVWSSNAYQPNTKITPKQNVAVQDESVTFVGVLCNYIGKSLAEDVGHLKATITDPNGKYMYYFVVQIGMQEDAINVDMSQQYKSERFLRMLNFMISSENSFKNMLKMKHMMITNSDVCSLILSRF